MKPSKPQGMTKKGVLEHFGPLDPVKPDELLQTGTWDGEEIVTGHPMDGMLPAVGWRGKTFKDTENVFPLLYKIRGRKPRYANVGKLPLAFFMNFPRSLVKLIFFFVAPFYTTKKSCTRLRMIQLDDELPATATMVYDRIPMLEHLFRSRNTGTILGLADLKGIVNGEGEKIYFCFKLTKPKQGETKS